jgi:hypothetical protein
MADKYRSCGITIDSDPHLAIDNSPKQDDSIQHVDVPFDTAQFTWSINGGNVSVVPPHDVGAYEGIENIVAKVELAMDAQFAREYQSDSMPTAFQPVSVATAAPIEIVDIHGTDKPPKHTMYQFFLDPAALEAAMDIGNGPMAGSDANGDYFYNAKQEKVYFAPPYWERNELEEPESQEDTPVMNLNLQLFDFEGLLR